MTVEHFLGQAVVILAACVVVVLASQKLRIAPAVGLLLSGVLLGPSGLRLVAGAEEVELFAEIGVIFLLFSIGLEFSLERLKEIRRPFFLGGSLQSLLAVGAAAAVAVALGFSPTTSLFFGFLIALSSTAIVLKQYTDRQEVDAPQGRVAVGILLFQDFLIVPMIVLTPVLAGRAEQSAGALLLRLALSVGAVALVVVVARFVMPRVLYRLVRTRVRELLVLGALLACLGMAVLTSSLGFSLALGAFIAGIVVSESEYSHQVVAEVTPFRDVFTSVFFVSVGMMVNLGFVRTHLAGVAALVVAVFSLKVLTTGGAVALLAFPVRIVVIAGFGLAQIGEFSFVLLKVGRDNALIDPSTFQYFIAAAVITSLLTPSLIAAAPRVGEWIAGALAGGHGTPAPPRPGSEPPERRNHVVVVGFGPAGRALARVLAKAHLPYAVIELNGDTVRRAREEGEPILYGDSTRPEALKSAGVAAARVVVFVISDLVAVRRSIATARDLNPTVHIIVRTRQQAHIEELVRCGADEVIAEEFETSIEILTRVLRRLHVPRNLIVAETRLLRGERYSMLRAPATDAAQSQLLLDVLAAGTTELYQIIADSPVIGKTMRELDLRRRSGATVIAVVRGEASYPVPPPEFRIEHGDCLVLAGSHADVDQAFRLLDGGDDQDRGIA